MASESITDTFKQKKIYTWWVYFVFYMLYMVSCTIVFSFMFNKEQNITIFIYDLSSTIGYNAIGFTIFFSIRPLIKGKPAWTYAILVGCICILYFVPYIFNDSSFYYKTVLFLYVVYMAIAYKASQYYAGYVEYRRSKRYATEQNCTNDISESQDNIIVDFEPNTTIETSNFTATHNDTEHASESKTDHSSSNISDTLRTLKLLYDDGVLTQYEFEEKKKELLNIRTNKPNHILKHKKAILRIALGIILLSMITISFVEITKFVNTNGNQQTSLKSQKILSADEKAKKESNRRYANVINSAVASLDKNVGKYKSSGYSILKTIDFYSKKKITKKIIKCVKKDISEIYFLLPDSNIDTELNDLVQDDSHLFFDLYVMYCDYKKCVDKLHDNVIFNISNISKYKNRLNNSLNKCKSEKAKIQKVIDKYV